MLLWRVCCIGNIRLQEQMVEKKFGLQKKLEALQKNEAFCGFPRNVQMHYIQLESD